MTPEPLIRPSLIRLAVFAGFLAALVTAGFVLPAPRIRAVTFDGDLRAGTTTNTLNLGGQGEWDTVNNTIFFKPLFLGVGNVGIGASDPQARLEIAGGLRLSENILGGAALRSQTCTSATRGSLAVAMETGTDSLSVCVKNASDTYTWVGL